MVSLPSFDPNLFVNGISTRDYRALMDNPSRPLFNRNVLGGGPPGSTIKPFLGLAGLDSGLRTPQDKVFSTGEFHIPGQRRGYRDAHGGAGWTDLSKSIAQSVNYYYYKLAYDMGIDRFDQWMRRYGFGEPTGIDLIGESAGIVPSPEWKAQAQQGAVVCRRDRDRRHRPGLLEGHAAAAGARRRGDRRRRPAPAPAPGARSDATATPRRGCRCRNRRRCASPTTPTHLRAVQRA